MTIWTKAEMKAILTHPATSFTIEAWSQLSSRLTKMRFSPVFSHGISGSISSLYRGRGGVNISYHKLAKLWVKKLRNPFLIFFIGCWQTFQHQYFFIKKKKKPISHLRVNGSDWKKKSSASLCLPHSCRLTAQRLCWLSAACDLNLLAARLPPCCLFVVQQIAY